MRLAIVWAYAKQASDSAQRRLDIARLRACCGPDGKLNSDGTAQNLSCDSPAAQDAPRLSWFAGFGQEVEDRLLRPDLSDVLGLEILHVALPVPIVLHAKVGVAPFLVHHATLRLAFDPCSLARLIVANVDLKGIVLVEAQTLMRPVPPRFEALGLFLRRRRGLGPMQP